VLNGGGFSKPRPGRFTCKKGTRHSLERRRGGPQRRPVSGDERRGKKKGIPEKKKKRTVKNKDVNEMIPV